MLWNTMKRYISLILVTLLVAISAEAQEMTQRQNFNHNNLRYYGVDLNGDIASITITHCYDNGKRREVTYKFNVEGDVTEMWGDSFGVYDSDKRVYLYDESGNTSEILCYYHNELVSRYVYTYDAEGREIEHAAYNADDTLTSKTTTKYDEQGRRIRRIERDYDDQISQSSEYLYDDRGNLAEFAKYDNTDGEMLVKEIYQYDSDGELVVKELYGYNGVLDVKFSRDKIVEEGKTLMRWTTYHYFDDGSIFMLKRSVYDDNRLLREESYMDDALTNMNIYEYDAEQRVTRVMSLSYGRELTREKLYRYDNDGRRVEMIERDGNGSLKRHRLYTYDSKGNVIEFETFDYVDIPSKHTISKYEIVYRE